MVLSFWRHFTQLTIRKWVFVAFGLGLFTLMMFSYYISSLNTHNHITPGPKQPDFKCHSHPDEFLYPIIPRVTNEHMSSAQLRLDPKVLVFVETQYSLLGRQICELLEATRFKFKVEIAGKGLPMMTNLDKGKFAVIVFENIEKYYSMSKWNKELMEKYCREYKVGIIGFVKPSEDPIIVQPTSARPFGIYYRLALSNYRLNPDNRILRITRPGETYMGSLGPDWAILVPVNDSYIPLAWAQPILQDKFKNYRTINGTIPELITVLQDPGTNDNIHKVVFGAGFHFWLHRLLFLDSISYLSHGKLSLPLQRYLLIDIDDIFVGEKTTRMTPSDVYALLDYQKRLQRMVSGFRFNLGFSGKFYHKGTVEENDGDDLLIAHADQFWWFGHMWSHSQPHLTENITHLETEMKLNKEFAKKHDLPIDSGYSIAPHHSGVFPAHEPLYEAWKRVWNVRVTSTEEYPHLRPARLRRGFIHRNIMVLPRQTCGLYTHTIFFNKYPTGPEKLEASIHGGELFYTFVTNPINVFMTHLSNYGNDRLALYTFESVIKFVRCWTNLGLSTIPPLQLAEKYFQTFPEEADPLWSNPCEDKRHLSIWSQNKSCEQLPKFLVIGPQKTGTTALFNFLNMHPAIVSNYPSPDTFEEVQFFNGRNYYKGLDWYMNFFPVPKNSTDRYLFEKSATYFDGELVPLRAHTLLPAAKLVTILTSPVKRAYSWYQHTRVHQDPAALNYSFYEVITAGEKAPKPLRDLRNRCMNPGFYDQHLERWLALYPPSQLLVIDGDKLRSDPVNVMSVLQRFLQIRPYYDYTRRLRFDPKKGFFCQVNQHNATQCLGRSKGRHYPPIDPEAEKVLKDIYLAHNVALSKLLTRIHMESPEWLKEALGKKKG